MSERILPFMHRENTCFFTGHRFIGAAERPAVIRETERAVCELAERGIRYFMAGGALGFDMAAEQTVLRAESYGISLVLALPCRNQTELWRGAGTNALLREYNRIAAKAAAVVYVSDFYYEGCMKERNRFMCDNSSVCIAYYNGAVHSGTGQSFRMAKSAGLEIINIFERTGCPGNTEKPV